jgi:hypothetical protein
LSPKLVLFQTWQFNKILGSELLASINSFFTQLEVQHVTLDHVILDCMFLCCCIAPLKLHFFPACTHCLPACLLVLLYLLYLQAAAATCTSCCPAQVAAAHMLHCGVVSAAAAAAAAQQPPAAQMSLLMCPLRCCCTASQVSAGLCVSLMHLKSVSSATDCYASSCLLLCIPASVQKSVAQCLQRV